MKISFEEFVNYWLESEKIISDKKCRKLNLLFGIYSRYTMEKMIRDSHFIIRDDLKNKAILFSKNQQLRITNNMIHVINKKTS